MIDALHQRSILAELFPRKLLDTASEGRSEEFLQPLIDLGYISAGHCQPEVIEVALGMDMMKGPAALRLEDALLEGMAQFRSDAQAIGFLNKNEIASDLGEAERSVLHPGTNELVLLHDLVSLDGEHALSGLPEMGETGLKARILHYQLDVFGMLDGHVNQPFRAESLRQLQTLMTWLGVDRMEDVLLLISDAEALAQEVLKSETFQLHSRMFAFFKLPFDGRRRVGNEPRHFLRELENAVDPLKFIDFQKLVDVKRLILRRRILEPDEVTAIAGSDINLFIVRLVQVRQWMRGFYRGRLDSEFGPMSMQSLLDYAEAHEVELDDVLVKAGDVDGGPDFWCLNFVSLLKGMVQKDGETEAENLPELVSQFEGELDRAESEERIKAMLAVGDSFIEHNESARKDLSLGRRLYYGTRSLVRSISRGLRRLMEFLIGGARKLLQLGKNLAKLLFRTLREGLRVFGRGLKFLFSSRTVSTVVGTEVAAITKFDSDMDVVSFYKLGVPPEAMALHNQSLASMVNGLAFSLELSGVVLNLVVNILRGPVGWVKLAIALAKQLATMLGNKLLGNRSQQRGSLA